MMQLILLNSSLSIGNDVLGDKYKPFEVFDQFDFDDAPSTSDVTRLLLNTWRKPSASALITW